MRCGYTGISLTLDNATICCSSCLALIFFHFFHSAHDSSMCYFFYFVFRCVTLFDEEKVQFPFALWLSQSPSLTPWNSLPVSLAVEVLQIARIFGSLCLIGRRCSIISPAFDSRNVLAMALGFALDVASTLSVSPYFASVKVFSCCCYICLLISGPWWNR